MSPAAGGRTTDRGLGPESERAVPPEAETLPNVAAAGQVDDEVDAQVAEQLRPMLHPEEDELEDDDRPRWVRASMPKNEWERALRASDAALAKAQPGSTDFARLMEARMRMHFPRPKNLNWEDIEAYKSAQYRAALAEDLRKELAREEGLPLAKIGIGAAVVLLLAMCGYFVWMLLRGPAQTGAAPADAAPKPHATQAFTAQGSGASRPDPAIPAPQPVVQAQPTEEPATSAAPPATIAAPKPGPSAAKGPATNDARSAAPAVTLTPTAAPSAPPAASTGEGLFFKPAPR